LILGWGKIIAHIYGVEDRALVMELVEGESPKGPMPRVKARSITSEKLAHSSAGRDCD
jgi:hypothetical protein